MKRKPFLLLVGAVLPALGLLGQSPVQAYDKWVEFTIVKITEPATGSTVPKGKSITLKCVAAVDIDVDSCVSHPTQRSDPLTFTWSADGGYFTDETGDTATWVAPNTTGEVTITVTASDETTAPVYANDDTNRSDSITVNVVNPGIVYVHDTAGGLNNGTSWANAYCDLNTAIANASAGSELWVAGGTYTPTATDQENSISLSEDLKLYGGFAGVATETALYQRDWVANVTTLSGDIGTQGVATDNSDQVVIITNSSVVLDGFTISGGDGWIDGAGVFVEDCSPTIRNCTFTDNLCDGEDADGGGLSCWSASPTVVNCVFTGNTAGDDGGGAANKCNSNGKYFNCAFYSNVAQGDDLKGDGGAVFNSASEADPQPCNLAFVNCVFANNSTYRYGGAVALQEATSPSSTATYLNCTFYGNTAGTAGDVISCRNGNTTTLKNCILWANNTDGGTDDIFNNGSTVNITYSDVQGCTPANGNINADPLFAKTSNLVGPDNRWLTCDDGLRIRFNSPCIDRGDGDAKDGYTDAGANERDALGLKHIDIRTVTNQGTGTPTCFDMGAYEAAVEHAIFISVDALASLYLNTANLMGDGSAAEKVDYMKRIKNEGAWTFNARSDPCYTETTPNHVTMLTGRPVFQPTGWANTTHHGWWWNDSPTNTAWTLHGSYGTGQGNSNIDYEGSFFDVVHDNGGRTAEYAGKDKFCLHEWSYDLVDGRADQIAPNNGRDKIDTFEWTGDNEDWNSSVLMSKFISNNKPEYDFNFVFLHFKGPDKVGHQSGWGSTAWYNAVEDVNERLATVFAMVESQSNPAWYCNTLLVMTADHGGHGTSGHGTPTDRYNYTVPMGVWGHLIPPGVDLYALATNRTDPGTSQKLYTDAGQPIRHADGADLCLNLMGLPSIDGASIKDMKFGQ